MVKPGQMDLGTHTLNSEDETVKSAAALADLVEPGDVLALTGELGAGKTRFVQGLAQGLNVAEDTYVRSPTFAIIHEYPARIPLYHVDLFRIGSMEEVEELGLHEYFEGEGVTAVEWFDRFPAAWPPQTLEIHLMPVAGMPDSRTMMLRGEGDRPRELAHAWLELLLGKEGAGNQDANS